MSTDEPKSFEEIQEHLKNLKNRVKINYTNFKKIKEFIEYREKNSSEETVNPLDMSSGTADSK